MNDTIVVIEDEATIASSVAARLTKEGFRVEVALTGPDGVDACRRHDPDLVILDLMLPGLDGLEVCRLIQEDHPVPVIMLTARDSETDVLVGLGVGADDYVTKPFSQKELVARVHAVLRRTRRARTGAPLTVGAISIDPRSRRVVLAGDEVRLTATEFDLLVYLAAHPETVYSRDQLMNEVWGYADPSGGRTIDSHVRSLRKKLGTDAIRTVHGVGYAMGAG